MHALFRLCLLLLGLLLWQATCWAAAPEGSAIRIRSATLVTKTGERTVALPHVTDDQAFDARGSRVRYRLSVDLPEAPREPLGVYISKLSLSGALYLNGQFVEQCARGALERLRCLHQPLLFEPAMQLWQAGTNTLEIEVYGNHRQVNGLSEVRIDHADRLYRDLYAPHYWRVVKVTEGLGDIVIALGILALAVGLSRREEAIYLWYGLTCLFLAASFTNLIADELPISEDLLSWIIVVGRLLAAHFFAMTCLHLFGKARRWHGLWTGFYAVSISAVLYLFNQPRWLVAAAYLPILLITPVLILSSIRWSLQSRRTAHVLTSLMLAFLFALGTRDWLQFGGQGSFEYVYLIPYGFSVTVLFMGYLLVAHLIDSLRRARVLSANLEAQVARRTAELASALQTVQHLEQSALKLTEAIPVGTYVLEVSPQGEPHFTFLSKRWLEMLSLEREAVMADFTRVVERIHPDDLDGFMARHLEVVHRPHPFSWEGRMVAKGETRWMNVEAVPRTLPNGNTAFEGVVVDVTVYKETQQALKDAYEQLTEAAIEHSKNEEREQLLQDMHDGFGSQLATARLMAETGQITPSDLPAILQECMADLYLVADTLSHSNHTLVDTLVDMKFRMEKRTLNLPVDLHWQIDLDDEPTLSQRTILQVLRIIQEAIHNALKHARATNIEISLTRSEGTPAQLCARVCDDGVGYPEQPVLGRGVHNMRQRARTLGAALSITPNTPGTCVSLTLPVT